ncbi:MAG: hypothetical protein ABR562_08565 [Thermoplasmatota archaeon]
MANTTSAPGAAGPAKNATMAILAPASDPWAGATQRVLFDAAVDVGACANWDSPQPVGEVGVGCLNGDFYFPLPEGTFLPAGTAALRADVDTTAAQVAGGYIFCLSTPLRDTPALRDGEITTDRVHTWNFTIAPLEWDPPAAHASSVYFCIYPHGGTPAALQGTVKVRLTAFRDPAWRPRPAYDPWAAGHRLVAPGVMSLLDRRRPWNESDYRQPLADAVPMGASQVTVVLAWGPISQCEPQYTCWISASVDSGGQGWKNEVDAKFDAGGGWKVYVYAVGQELVPDGPDIANASATHLNPFFYQCEPAGCDTLDGGSYPYVQGRTADVRFVVDAWQGPADVAALKARLGLS